MSLQNELDDFMAGVRKQVPADILNTVERAYDALGEPGRFPKALGVGDTAPDFTLGNATGQPVSLAATLTQGPVVLSFYRGAWCPFCNLELRALQAALPEIQAAGARLIAISPELPDYSLPLVEREQLQFEVLSDVGNATAQSYGIAFPLEGELRRISLEVFGVDLPRFNGDETWLLPIPATYVIDRQGIIRQAFVDPEFRRRLEPSAIIAALASL